MDALCPFEGVSGDFDNCSSGTRDTYIFRALDVFDVSHEDYFAMVAAEDSDD